MSKTINLTPESIEKITRFVAKKAPGIGYEITIPKDAKEAIEKGVNLVWKKIVEEEMQYIDGVYDMEIVDEVLDEVEVDIDDLIEANESLKVEQFFLPGGEGKPVSLEEFRVALLRAVTDDLKSAWMDVIRKAVEEVHGEDPLGGGDGLAFPEAD